MDIKRLVAMFMVALMLVALVPLAFADEGNETSDDDAECVDDLDCEEGYFCDEDECEEIESEEEVEDEAECVVNDDCDEGYFCDVDECEEIEEVEDEAETEAEDDEDEEEVKIMKTPHGASVRLIQLERSIQKNIDHGERIINAILANDENSSVEELNKILDDLNALIDELHELSLEDKSPQELAEEYVEIKSRARELAKEFRTQAREFFTEEDAEALRERLKEWKSENDEAYRNRVEEARQKYNEAHLRLLLTRLGIEDEELIDEVVSKATKLGEVRSIIAKQAREVPIAAKLKAVKEFREDKEREDVFKKAAVINVRTRVAQKLRERAENQEPGEGPLMAAQRVGAERVPFRP